MIIAAPSPHHVRTAVDAQTMGDLGAADQVFGEFAVVGNEPAQIHDPADRGILGGVGDVGGGAVVDIAGSPVGQCPCTR